LISIKKAPQTEDRSVEYMIRQLEFQRTAKMADVRIEVLEVLEVLNGRSLEHLETSSTWFRLTHLRTP
jgi:hypothetical protein